MVYSILKIKGIEYAVATHVLDRMYDGLVIQSVGEGCRVLTSYGLFDVEGHSVRDLADLINFNKHEEFIAVLVKAGANEARIINAFKPI